MTEYNISAFIQIMQSGLIENNKKESTGRLLFDAIKTDEYIDFSATTFTRLINREREVQDLVKTASARPKVIEDAIKYFNSKVVPDLNPHLKEDTCSQIINLLTSDESVSPLKSEALISLYNKGKLDEFLAKSFLYAISKKNKPVGTHAEIDDVPFILEADNECPICKEPLTELVKNKTLRQYSITTIRPEILIDEKCSSKKHKLSSHSNKIALCKKCVAKINLDTEYSEELSTIKEQFIYEQQLEHELRKMTLEKEIKDTIVALDKVKEVNKLEKLSLNAMRVDQKILPENTILLDDLTTYVLKYFYFIKNAFSETDNFESIALDVRKVFLKLEKNCQTQHEIVRKLSKWIWEQTGLPIQYERACDIIVAFFVQNCEVFNEISE